MTNPVLVGPALAPCRSPRVQRCADAEGDAPTFEEVVEGIGDMLERSLTPPGGGNSEAGKAIVRALSEAARARGNARTES